MFVSYVVRLQTAQLRRGAFAGEVVGVASGHRHGIASLEQLAAFLTQTCADEEEMTLRPVQRDEEALRPW